MAKCGVISIYSSDGSLLMAVIEVKVLESRINNLLFDLLMSLANQEYKIYIESDECKYENKVT